MAFVKMGDLDKLGPEERKQFENLMQQFPHLRSKIEVSRELNTGTPPPPPPEGNTSMPVFSSDDLPEGLEIDWDALNAAPSSTHTHLGQGRLGNSAYNQGSLEEVNSAAEKDHLMREADATKQHERVAAAANSKPVFSPVGKVHPVLSKIRQTLGMDNAEKMASIKVGDSYYKMKRLSRDEIIKLTGYANMRSTSDIELRGNVEMSLVAFAVQEIDSVASVVVFEVPLEEYSYVLRKNSVLTPQERRERAAHSFFDLLKEAPNELTDALLQFYEQEFPNLNLLDKDMTQALCPESGCAFKALIGKDEKRFCPHHGKELMKEGALPNPF